MCGRVPCAGRVWRVSLLPVLRDGHGGGRARLRGGGGLRHVVDYDVCARAGGGSTREQAVAVTICREKGEWDGAEGRVRRRAGRRRGWQRRRVGPHAAGRAAVVRGGGVRIFLLCRSVCDVCARRTLCTPRVAAGCRKRAVAGWAMRRAAPSGRRGWDAGASEDEFATHTISHRQIGFFFEALCCGS